MMIGGVENPKCESFRYLWSAFQRNGGFKENVNHEIKAGQHKYYLLKRVPVRLNRKCYMTIVQAVMLNDKVFGNYDKAHKM